MSQPSTQQVLATGHTSEYFWYAQGTGIFDARNNAMLAKTGSANTATEGGALVALANGSTTYALAAAISQSQPWTLMFKARVDSTAGTDGMPMGDPTTANDFVRMQRDSGTLSIRVASSSTASVTATLTTMTTWAFVSSGGLLSIYKDGVAQGSPQPINAAPLIISKLFDGYAGGGFVFKGALEFVNVVPSALDATAIAARFADPYSVLTTSGASALISATTANSVFSGNAKVSPKSLIAATTANSVFSGSASANPKALIAATTAGAAFSGGAAGSLTSGTITTEAFKNASGTLLSGLTVDKLWAIPLTAPTFSNVSTNGSGVLTVSGGGMVAGTDYLLVSCDSTGANVGVKKYTAT